MINQHSFIDGMSVHSVFRQYGITRLQPSVGCIIAQNRFNSHRPAVVTNNTVVNHFQWPAISHPDQRH